MFTSQPDITIRHLTHIELEPTDSTDIYEMVAEFVGYWFKDIESEQRRAKNVWFFSRKQGTVLADWEDYLCATGKHRHIHICVELFGQQDN